MKVNVHQCQRIQKAFIGLKILWPKRPCGFESRPRHSLSAIYGRLRRDAHRYEACRRVWQALHNEPVLLISTAGWTGKLRDGQGTGGCEDAPRLGHTALWRLAPRSPATAAVW